MAFRELSKTTKQIITQKVRELSDPLEKIESQLTELYRKTAELEEKRDSLRGVINELQEDKERKFRDVSQDSNS